MPKGGEVSGGRKAKFEKVMAEFAAGTLRSSSGQKVTDRAQALAIARSVSVREGKRGKGLRKRKSA